MSIQVYYDLPGNSISRNCGNKVRIKERKENFLKNFPVRRFRGKEPQPPAAGCGTGKYAAAVNVREASDHHEFYTTGSCGVYRLRTGYTLVCHTDLRRNSPGRFSGSEEGAVSRDFTGRPAGYHTRFRACGNRRCTLWYVLFNWEYYHSFFDVINIRAGGLAIHGGLIFGAVTAVLMCRKKRCSPLDVLDVAFPCIALAQAIGRWGNFFNQEAHGTPTDLPWAITIDGVKVHPTFLYESLWCLMLFFLLSYIDREKAISG